MSETRKIAAILVADVAGYSRLAGADEDRTLSRLRGLRSDLIDPAIAAHRGRVVKRTGDGILIEFRSVVDAVRCAIEVQNGLTERNAGVPPERRIEFRVGIHLGDVVEESDGDLMGDGVNIAARLEGICAPGAICLSEQAYWQVKQRLDFEVSDLGLIQLKNIAEPVRVYSLDVGAPGVAKLEEPKRRFSPVLLALGIAALAALAAGIGWYLLVPSRNPPLTVSAPAPVASNPAAPAEAAHLSIVVLPFTNLSGDPNQDYFADGITDNLTTDLSRIRNSFAIARNTAFTYKGKSVDAKQIGKELGVRYVLEGSVQRDGTRVRVNAQLIDAESGAHLWADRFEEDITDLFKLQDEVVARLGRSLDFALTKAEAEKGGRSKNPDAADLTMRGDDLMWQRPKEFRDCVHEARALFERALKIDPNDVGALAGSAQTYVFDWNRGWGDPGADYDAKILGPANQAIILAPDDPRSYFPKAQYLGLSRRPSEALDAANAGLAINPNDIGLLIARAIAENSLGQYEQAKADMERAIRLSPRDSQVGVFHIDLGEAEIGLGHFDAAIDELHKAIDLGSRPFFAYTNLAAAFAHAGKMDEAKAALAEARRLNPAITIKWLKEHTPNLPASFDGLRKAGLPEDAPPEPAHLSIVVLPFTNLSGDPAQDYFADGINENLTTDLSRIPNSFVIARNTAFTYKGRNVDAKDIGKELGVRYVLEGSVQRDQNRVRVNAQLIDAESGAHLWADRFEEDVADLFKLQDQVVARLANSLGNELVKAEAGKSAGAKNPDAIDLAMRGWATMWRSYAQPMKEKEESHRAALALFDQALKIDPNDADALAGDAFTYMAFHVFGWPTTEADFDAKVIGQADRSVALAPDNMRAYVAKSYYLNMTGRPNDALRTADAGLAINPNYAPLLDARVSAETTLGRFEQAKADAQQAARLGPRDPEMATRLINLGLAELGLGRFDAAVVEFQKAMDASDHSFIPEANLAAAYALEGKTEEAKAALTEARRLNPNLTIKWLTAHAPNIPALFDGLRKAGLAEE
jgi:adenylate cyclase